ncbi:2-dehydropantoate 2-reductase [Kitasatospora sp. RB6PN24]|uniref:2-dehydropantoate 2-reductase n=1 Tax=Kitasatospora humi TaxID=2893891 RepID=UPI001E55A692|nr:2-dehydropantoate 2-reductase [Kitasatospora humi]MCC9308456.1 2-dehydropantoate 2-reductase [Kitasatospora humi]
MAPRTAPRRPKIAVFGAGSVGCYLGGHLAAHADVTLIGRPAVLDALADGLTLSDGDRPPRVVPPGEFMVATGAAAAAGADYVLVTVKSAATAAAAEELARALGGRPTVVVSFQNGLHNPQVLRAALPRHTVLAGMVPYNVLQTAPGTFHRGTAGALTLADEPAAGALVTVLTASGLAARTAADIGAVQRAKLLVNLNNAINALSGLPLRDQLGQRAFRRCLALCQLEGLAAFRAAGLSVARLGPFPAPVTARLLGLPDQVFRRLAAASLRVDAQARSSMWEDLRRGRPTEIASLQGEIVALAAEHGLTAPANARLLELVREAERAAPGRARPWSGPGLLAEVRTVR